MQVTPHFSQAEIERASSPVEDTVFKGKPWELALRMSAVFSRLEAVRCIFIDTDYIIIPTSYLRSKEKNKFAGGKPNSRHLRGIAVDCTLAIYETRVNYFEVAEHVVALKYFLNHFDYAYVGEGKQTPFIHADLRDTFPGDVV